MKNKTIQKFVKKNVKNIYIHKIYKSKRINIYTDFIVFNFKIYFYLAARCKNHSVTCTNTNMSKFTISVCAVM
jgi:hypothetical protein